MPTPTTTDPVLSDRQVDDGVRAYRALTDKSQATPAMRDAVRAYRARLRARAGTAPARPRTRRQLVQAVADQVTADTTPPTPRLGHVTVDARAFRDLLVPYRQFVGKRAILPIFTTVKLLTVPGWLFVVGTDMERTLESRIPIGDDAAELFVAAPFQALLEVARAAVPRSKKTPATLRLTHQPDQGTLTATAGPLTRTLRLLDVNDWPAPPAPIDQIGWRVNGGTLAAALVAGHRSSADDDARPILSGPQLGITDAPDGWGAPHPNIDPFKRLTVAATDTYRLTVRHLPLRRGGKVDFSAVVHRDTAKLAATLFKTSPEVTVSADGGRVLLADQTRSLHVRAVEGDYPAWPMLIPDHTDGDYRALEVDRDQLTGFLAGLPKGQRATPVLLTLFPDRLVLSFHEQDVADTTVTLAARWDGEDGLRVQFNPGYLADTYANLDGPVTLWLKGGLKPALATSPDTDGLYLLMPIRIPD